MWDGIVVRVVVGLLCRGGVGDGCVGGMYMGKMDVWVIHHVGGVVVWLGWLCSFSGLWLSWSAGQCGRGDWSCVVEGVYRMLWLAWFTGWCSWMDGGLCGWGWVVYRTVWLCGQGGWDGLQDSVNGVGV